MKRFVKYDQPTHYHRMEELVACSPMMFDALGDELGTLAAEYSQHFREQRGETCPNDTITVWFLPKLEIKRPQTMVYITGI